MQNRGVLSPSVVLDVVKNPTIVQAGKTVGSMHYIREGVNVITNAAGDIITVYVNTRK